MDGTRIVTNSVAGLSIVEAVKRLEALEAAVKRLATTEAFFVARPDIDPETFGRIRYAQMVRDGITPEAAEKMAEHEAQEWAKK